MAYSWLFKLLELSSAFYCRAASQGLRYLFTIVCVSYAHPLQ